MWEMRNACRIVVGQPGGKIQHRRLRRRWDDNIKIVIEIGCGVVDWIQVA
jgi:hypothetical protein